MTETPRDVFIRYYHHRIREGGPGSANYEADEFQRELDAAGLTICPVAQTPQYGEEKELFAAITSIDLADLVKRLRKSLGNSCNWQHKDGHLSYQHDEERAEAADLIEGQARLIAWFVNSRAIAQDERLSKLRNDLIECGDDLYASLVETDAKTRFQEEALANYATVSNDYRTALNTTEHVMLRLLFFVGMVYGWLAALTNASFIEQGIARSVNASIAVVVVCGTIGLLCTWQFFKRL